MAKERYLRMQHDCFDALTCLPMSDGERRVMMIIIRYTVGFHRFDAELSNRFLSEFLHGDITPRHAGRCVESLCKRGYIKVISPGIGSHPRKICFCYSVFRGTFRALQGDISGHLEGHSDAVSGTQLCPKEMKEENKNKEKKNKERFASEPSSLFSQDSPGSGEEEPDEEWWELHKDDDE